MNINTIALFTDRELHLSKAVAEPVSSSRVISKSDNTMLLIKLFTVFGLLSTGGGAAVIMANWDGATIGIVIAAIGTLIAAISSAVVAIMTSGSKNKIEEMKVQMELERVRNECRHEEQKVSLEAQKAVSLVNAQALTHLQASMATNTAETVKSTVAADQTKARVEELTKVVGGKVSADQ